MPTIGAFSGWPPSEPANGASNANTPPSAATSQYPPVAGSAAMATMGWSSAMPPVEPRKAASPKAKTPPSAATSQYPPPSAVVAMPTTGRLGDDVERSPRAGAPNARTALGGTGPVAAAVGRGGSARTSAAGTAQERGEGGRAAERRLGRRTARTARWAFNSRSGSGRPPGGPARCPASRGPPRRSVLRPAGSGSGSGTPTAG